MPFPFRSTDDTANPTLARLYGNGSTKGQVYYFERDGNRTKFILLLAQGGKHGCDGIDKYKYDGFDVPSEYWRFHPGTRSLGYTDPLQGRPEFFPNINFTFSGICYLEVFLPEDRSPKEADTVPDGSEVFMRGMKLTHYDLVDGRLQDAGAEFTANNILCYLDVMMEVGQLPLTRFQKFASTWKEGEARCDEALAWDRGDDHGGVIYIPRFDCHMGIAQAVDPFTAANQMLARAPGMKYQDVNGGLRLLPTMDRAAVHTLIYDPTQSVIPSNILRRGLSLTPRSADKLFNWYIFGFRDLLDDGYAHKWIDNIFYDELREQAGGLIPAPVQELGLMNQSLAERMGRYIARSLTGWYEDGRLVFPVQYEAKGMADSYHVAKNDNIDLVHEMTGTTEETPILCSVFREGFESRAGERSFLVQRTSRTELYSDGDHSPVQGSGTSFGIITSSPLPDATLGAAYSVTLQASGGSTPYLWSLDSGTLPDGLALSAEGIISGVPTVGDDFSFTAKVTDSLGLTDTKAFALATSGVGIVTPSPLPGGTVGHAYSQSLVASGGVLPYVWTLDSGSLPTGLSLSSSGAITGSPTTNETQTANIKVTDADANTKIKAFDITIGELTIDDLESPNGTVGFAYHRNLVGHGGTLPYTWTLDSGTLPDGVTLSTSGVLNGNPSVDDVFVFTVLLTDAEAGTATREFTVTIIPYT